MKLVRADGNIRTQRSLSAPYVRTIVDTLLQHKETLGFVAEVLQKHVQPFDPDLAQTLTAIRTSYSQLDVTGNTTVPAYIQNLLQALEQLYRQNAEDITDQRGAVVELLGRHLVCPCYESEIECSNSQRFLNEQGKEITIQEVDVAALSRGRRQLEAYECKLKAAGLASDDCVDLAFLLNAAQNSGYRANAGIISFDSDRTVLRRLRRFIEVNAHLPAIREIKAYGLESIDKLQTSPF